MGYQWVNITNNRNQITNQRDSGNIYYLGNHIADPMILWHSIIKLVENFSLLFVESFKLVRLRPSLVILFE